MSTLEEEESMSRKAIALFMAFGTKGDVFPLAAIAAAFARNQQHYSVVLMSHFAHENLSSYLIKAKVSFFPITSPPALSSEAQGTQNTTDSLRTIFLEEKERIKREHRQECHSAFGSIFGKGPCMEGDFVVINFFALEGWSLAEIFQIRCVVAAPYVVPYSPPTGFERQFRKELPDLYKYLKEAPIGKVSWSDVTHWMWPLFTEEWGSWRYEKLNLSCYPFADPVTDLPIWHSRPPSPLVFMGFVRNPLAFLRVLQSVIQITGYRFIIFTAGYGPLDAAVWTIANGSDSSEKQSLHAGISIFNGKLFCFSGMVPYNWLFRRCAAAIHHGGSGSVAAALQAGLPQIICPFMLDQFYWAEKMSWLGVAPQPLKRNQLLLEETNDENITEAAQVVGKAIYDALSAKTRARAMEIAEILSLEDGVTEAVRVLREEVCEVSGSN